MLTGNLYQDYTTLVNDYNDARNSVYNRQNLTGIADMDAQILMRLNIKDLNKYCRTNADARQFCNNPQFWKQKIIYDQLPFHLIETQPQNVKEWFTTYRMLMLSVLYAKNTLLINEIEATRNVDPTPGLIYIDILKNALFSFITDSLNIDISPYIDNYYWRLEVKYISKNDYDIIVKNIKREGGITNTIMTTRITYDVMLDMMIRVYYSVHLRKEIAPMDDTRIPFVITPQNLQHVLQRVHDNLKIKVYRRLSILDTLTFQQKNQ